MRRRFLFTALAAAALAFGGALQVSADEGGCHTYGGEFTAVTVTECPSFLCTHGTLTGDLAGTYDFVATGATETGITGQSTITLDNGAVIRGSDVSVLGPDGTFVTTVNVVGGTRQFAQARGQLVASGHFTETGTEGVYAATICLGNGPPEN
jgi:hypothetical protein